MARKATAQRIRQATETIDEKVAFLSSPDAYVAPTRRVEVKETHMAWVFLTDRFAYKLKKPVRYAYLDYSTVEAREADCREEIRLNRRLAADVYLAVVPLTRDRDGRLALDGSGTVVDWLVKMRRLADELMLDRMIESGQLGSDDVARLAGVLTDFYRGASAIAMSPVRYRATLRRDIEAHCDDLLRAEFALSGQAIKRIQSRLLRSLRDRHSSLDARAAGGRIVDGHGDLRPEHVCLEPRPVIIDCLSFKRSFRLLDPVDEVAYLALECELLGAAWVGDQLLEHYQRALDDPVGALLIDFYKALRAVLRADLAILHLAETSVKEPEKWRPRANAYLALADRYASRLS